jgi:hypothetical protein
VGDRCDVPNPTEPWLELFCAGMKTIKKEKTPAAGGKEGKDGKDASEASLVSGGGGYTGSLYAHPRQHVLSAELTSVGGGKKGSEPKPFFVTADGVEFGPYHTVRVTPAYIDDKSQSAIFSMPFQCFQPIHL